MTADFAAYQRSLTRLQERHRLSRIRAKEEWKECKRLHQLVEDHEQAQAVAQQVAETVQQAAHQQIAAVVTRCLQAVFGPEAYSFRIRFSRKRGKTEAELLFERGGQEYDPTEASGGGPVDVASMALRIACLLLMRPRKRRLLLLDEPFRFVSREYRPAARTLLEALAREMSIQFVIVTHDPEFRAGKVVDLGDSDG